MAENPDATCLAELRSKLEALPVGTFRASTSTGRYIVTKTVFNAGRSFKLVAEELGGVDYISMNLYAMKSGTRLVPCEMSQRKVTTFVFGLEVDTDQDGA